MNDVTVPTADEMRAGQGNRARPGLGVRREVLVLAGLGFLLWYAGWGWVIDLVWREAGIPDRATWGRFFAVWVPATFFLFTLASLAFSLRESRQARVAILLQGCGSLSLLAFLILEVAARGPWLHVWLGTFFVGSVLVRGAVFFWPLWREWSTSIPSRAASTRIFVGSALVYTLLVPWVTRTLPVAGDEPHYLLISHSILVDHDLDLHNNYERGDYRAFHPGHISAQAAHAVSAHGVGFPLLLVPAYALGGRVGATWLVALTAALLSVNIYWFCLELSGSPRASLQAWALCAFTVPIVAYANQLFPEIPAALGTLYAYRQFRALPASGGGALLGGLLATFGVVFLKVRYAPVIVVQWIYLFARLARSRRWIWGCAAVLLAFILMLLTLDAWLFDGAVVLRRWAWEGAWWIMGRPNRFHLIAPVGLFLDQKNGLLPYSPIYILSAVGLALLMRERRPEGFVIPLAAALYLWALIALSDERWHGEFSPAPRYLVFLLPLLAGPMAVAFARCRGRGFELTRTALAVYSLVIAATLLLVPRWRFRAKTGQSMLFYMIGQGLSVNLIDWLPSFIVATVYTYLVAGIGLAVVVGAVAYLYATADR